MIKEINEFYKKIILFANKRKIIINNTKDIPYGIQLFFSDGINKDIALSVYFSQKKGISTVIGGAQKNPLYFIVRDLLADIKMEDNNKLPDWGSWCGTDESGKGDYFGPLVVCGFVSNIEIEKELIKIGVCDSKKLTDKKINEIALILEKRFPKNYKIINLLPSKYNQLYADFVSQKKKLNDLLAWMHSRIILDFYKQKIIEGAVIDKFADKKKIVLALADLKKVPMIVETKAESYLAVAAASIIARNTFIEALKEIGEKFEFSFNKGASKIVDKQIRDFISIYGIEKLKMVGKFHFSNTEKAINEKNKISLGVN